MTEDEIEQFTDMMVKKAEMHGFWDGRFHWQPGDEAEAFRGMIQNVIIDTELVVNGMVPLESWISSPS